MEKRLNKSSTSDEPRILESEMPHKALLKKGKAKAVDARKKNKKKHI